MTRHRIYLTCCCFLLIACKLHVPPRVEPDKSISSNYGSDRDFLEKYAGVVELQTGPEKVLIVPQYEGRVMTSSCEGDSGISFGWVNDDFIKSGKVKQHFNPFGGEERLWLAPEGGQFSFFFKSGVPYDFEHWFTPREFDTDSFHLVGHCDTAALFVKDVAMANRSGDSFMIHIDRRIRLLDSASIKRKIGVDFGSGVHAVAYESDNTLTNEGKSAWTIKTGAPAIWLLGQMKPSPFTTIVLPVQNREGDTTRAFHDTYFGIIPSDRWKIDSHHAYLKADGKFRGKVGVSPTHASEYIGSFDAQSGVLTLLGCSWPGKTDEFVNSAWEDQKDPFSGDSFNAYNDGPLKDGSQLGPFYELESLSPAAFLAPGQSITHTQLTYHLKGNEKMLNAIAEKTLGVRLKDIENAFN